MSQLLTDLRSRPLLFIVYKYCQVLALANYGGGKWFLGFQMLSIYYIYVMRLDYISEVGGMWGEKVVINDCTRVVPGTNNDGIGSTALILMVTRMDLFVVATYVNLFLVRFYIILKTSTKHQSKNSPIFIILLFLDNLSNTYR